MSKFMLSFHLDPSYLERPLIVLGLCGLFVIIILISFVTPSNFHLQSSTARRVTHQDSSQRSQ